MTSSSIFRSIWKEHVRKRKYIIKPFRQEIEAVFGSRGVVCVFEVIWESWAIKEGVLGRGRNLKLAAFEEGLCESHWLLVHTEWNEKEATDRNTSRLCNQNSNVTSMDCFTDIINKKVINAVIKTNTNYYYNILHMDIIQMNKKLSMYFRNLMALIWKTLANQAFIYLFVC